MYRHPRPASRLLEAVPQGPRDAGVSPARRSPVGAALAAGLVSVITLTPPATLAADAPIDFARDVQPILSDNCYRCHGPDAGTREGDLRLDTLDPKLGPFAPRDGYSIIAPGNLDDSVLVLRITSTDDPDTVMPPPKSNRTLTDAQRDTLKRWIQQGAKWGKHWSFEPPTRPATPDVKQKDWPKNPIDSFILARLETENVKPSPPASRETLIRRVTLDLTGLPPTPAEVDAFLADSSPDAYEKLVDRLLASPRYGEHMAWSWLDAARYSDTNGYQNDPTRTMWPWRDWLVRALNDNLPFDQFATQLVAGDLLPDATLDQRLASAFNRAHPFNGEGGRIPEETRVENVLDRTDTFGTVFLGLTVGCARCHDHKFDPVSQKEYYALSAFFNQSSETGQFQYVNGGNVLPVMDYATPEESAKSAELKKAWDDAQANLKKATPAIDAAQAKWEQSLLAASPRPSAPPTSNRHSERSEESQPSVAPSRHSERSEEPQPSVAPSRHSERSEGSKASATPSTSPPPRAAGVPPAQPPLHPTTWHITPPTSATSTNGATMQILSADASILVSGESPDTDVHEVTIRTPLNSITGLKLEALPDISLPAGGPGRANDVGNFVLTHLELSALSPANPAKPVEGTFTYADATYEQPGYPAENAFDADRDRTGWAVFKAPDKNNLSAIFALRDPLQIPGGAELRIRLYYNFPDNRKHTMGRFRLSLATGPVVPANLAAALNTPAHKRDKDQKKTIRDFYRNRINKDYKPLADAVAAAKQASQSFDASITKVMVMNDASPRDTFILSKGAYDKPTDKVPPATPAILTTAAGPSRPTPVGWTPPTSSRQWPPPTSGRHSERSEESQPSATPSTLPTTRDAGVPPARMNRLDLAHWLTSPTNPLTARVTVNRYWQHFFGTGIVKTAEDFGLQGERPSHPQLLDYLATEFVSSKWNVKHLHRLIVTSQTYKQSSKLTPNLLERDPDNRLLARAPRFRLPSPVLRDQALAASGLLVPQIGGAPVKPYQPPGIWEEATFGFIKYEQDHGPSLYRRSLYTFWRRIVGPTNLFDTPSRTVCTVRPSRTNTPLHALTTLNDPTYVEAARNLAQHLLETGDPSPTTRLTTAYRTLLSRPPTDKELQILTHSLHRLTTQYTQDKDAALKLLQVGESKRNESLNPTTHAAYTALCLGLLNLDETLSRE